MRFFAKRAICNIKVAPSYYIIIIDFTRVLINSNFISLALLRRLGCRRRRPLLLLLLLPNRPYPGLNRTKSRSVLRSCERYFPPRLSRGVRWTLSRHPISSLGR